ncbi:MAG: hypothetical protein ABSA57_00580 [Candidatus Acidiferrales bacterium]|jgi:hypothetical protein
MAASYEGLTVEFVVDFSGKQRLGRLVLAMLLAAPGGLAVTKAEPQTQTAGQTASSRPIGTIKSISGNALTLSSDTGVTYSISVEDGARILRIEPGAKDLKNSSPLQLADLQVGDRILVMGKVSDDGHSIAATSVIAMKKADVASKQEHDRQDWQRRGVGGLVGAVDVSSGTITISARSAAGSKNVAIHASKDTILRRYAPDSVNFDDAKPSSIDQIKPGDQVLARGTRSADGNDLAAEEIVSGAFRNIAGTVTSINTASNTLTVMDLIAKKPVDVKITTDAQLRKLPPQMAQLMAARLKGGQAGAGSGAAGNRAEASGGRPAADRPAGAAEASSAAAPGDGSGAGAGGGRGGRGGGGDLQQMLSRVPRATLADLQKGDAVMIVSTSGNASGAVTAITLVSGVEPILEASPSGGAQSMILPPWSMEAPTGDAAQ